MEAAAIAAAVIVVAREARAAPAKEARVAPAREARAAREAKVARVENQLVVLHDVVVVAAENRTVVFYVATRTLPTFTCLDPTSLEKIMTTRPTLFQSKVPVSSTPPRREVHFESLKKAFEEPPRTLITVTITHAKVTLLVSLLVVVPS
jgi:hypothetical protein